MKMKEDMLYYTKTHEWVKKKGDIYTVGISDYAQDFLGDIVYLELNPSLKSLKKREQFATIESVKAAEEIYSPLTAQVHAINKDLIQSPEQINKDAYGSWFIALKDCLIEELDELMNEEEYENYIKSIQKL